MKIKKLFSLLLAICLVFPLLLPRNVQASETESDFFGSRTLELTADSSDLEVFLDGGRAMLDLALRQHAPDWLVYNIKSQGRDVVLSLRIDFGSYEEYRSRISQLLTHSPSMLYTRYHGTVLIEEFSPLELLNFLQQALGSAETDAQTPLRDLMKVSSDCLQLDEETYEFQGENIRVCPENDITTPLQQLTISTEEDSDGILSRRIKVRLSAGSEAQQITERFERVGSVTSSEDEDGSLTVSVTFTANNPSKLAARTMTCLDIPVLVLDQYSGADGNLLITQRTELYLMDGLLEEGGSFNYNYDCAEYMEQICAVSENTSVDGQTVTATDQSRIQLQFSQPFRFTNVVIETDYSSVFWKDQRTILLSAPVEAAKLLHDSLKTKLSARLVPGTTLEIYDADGMRFYALRFSSWFDGQIQEFTENLLGSGTYSRTDSWLPFGESHISESYSSMRVLPKLTPAENVELRYIFSGITKIRVNYDDYADAEIEGSTIRFPGTEAVLSYHGLNTWKTIVEILALLAVVLPVVALILALRRRIGAAKKVLPETPVPPTEPEPEALEVPTPRFCTGCGSPLVPGCRFCTNCGKEISSE